MSHPLQKAAVDAAAIASGLTAPWWVKAQFWAEYMTTWLGWFAALCAALLAAWRLWAFWHDRRNGKKDG